MTLQLFDPEEIPQITLTSFVQDFRAKHLAWLEDERDLMTVEVLSFLRLHGFSNIIESNKGQSNVWFSKMLKAYLVTTVDAHLLSSTEFLVTLGIPLSSNYLILAGGYPKIENEYTLSDILETEVDHKYFLSEKMVSNLIKTDLREGGWSTDSILTITKEQTANGR